MAQETPQHETAVDPWASISASDDDLTPDVTPAVTLVDPVEESVFDEQVGSDEPGVGDDDSAVAARANESAVASAVADIESTSLPSRGGMFTIPLLCAGIAIIAVCLLIPQTDANRRLVYERAKLRADLESVEKQVTKNDDFLRKVGEDPNLAERLAQRQMKIIREGNTVLSLKGDGADEMSPFQLTAVAPPAEFPEYQPRGGLLAGVCYSPRSRLYLMGIGLMAMAGGLVLGFGPRPRD